MYEKSVHIGSSIKSDSQQLQDICFMEGHLQDKRACQYGGRVLFLSKAVVRDKPVFEVCFWSHLNNTILGRRCPLFFKKKAVGAGGKIGREVIS